MILTALLTSLPQPFAAGLQQLRQLGFTHVDLVGLTERPPEQLDALADSGLIVACVSAGRDLPAGCTLDAASLDQRRAAVTAVQAHIQDAARLGATHVYVVPGLDASAEGLLRFADSCALLAQAARARMLQFCVEHIPGRALPTVAATLAWLDAHALAEVKLLLDLGHCLISNEDPAEAVRSAGPRLGYVHFDDNDGVGDVHWPLLTGKLTQATLTAFVQAVRDVGYRGPLCLELNPQNPDPIEALRAGRELLLAASPSRPLGGR